MSRMGGGYSCHARPQSCDHRLLTLVMPGQSASGFHQSGRYCLHVGEGGYSVSLFHAGGAMLYGFFSLGMAILLFLAVERIAGSMACRRP